MIRPLEAGNSIKSLVRQADPPEEIRGIIKKVNRVTRHLHVLAGGYGLLRSVPVNRGINLGTPDRKVVFPGDTAVLIRAKRGWQCVGIEHKDRCGSKVSEFSGDVVIENQVEPVSADSYTMQQIGALSLPSDLSLPPFELLGQLSLPTQRFTGGTTMLCGLPPCVDCSPNGLSAGMSPVLSADETYPGGCWVWDFKVRGCLCTGNPALDVDYALSAFTFLDVSDIRTVTDGSYTYACWIETIGVSSRTWRFVVIDVSTPASPTVVGSTMILISELGIGPDAFSARMGGITKIFDTVWLTFAQDVVGTGPFNPTYAASHLVSVDVSNPALPLADSDTVFGSLSQDVALHAPKSFSLGGNLFLVAPSAKSVIGTVVDLAIYDINGPGAPTEVSFTAGPSGEMWLVAANAWQYVNGFIHLLRRNPTTQIDTYDVTVPASPSYVGVFSSGLPANDGAGQAFLDATSNRLVYIATNDNDTSNFVTKIDYSIPAAPVILDSFDAGVAAADDFRFIRICGTTLFFTAQRATGSGADTFIRAWADMSSLPTPLTVADFQGTDMQVNSTHLYLGGFASPSDGKSHLVIITC